MKSKQASQLSEISCGSVVVGAKDQVSCDLNGEAAILNLNDGMYYGLNEVGARIWSLLSEPITVSRIRDQLEREYDVDSDRCEKDLVKLLSQLQDAGLIEVKNEGAA
jgi:Coenzyme PQQ synthesis protein D (PqqD)